MLLTTRIECPDARPARGRGQYQSGPMYWQKRLPDPRGVLESRQVALSDPAKVR